MYKLVTNCRACSFGPEPSPGGIKAADNGLRLIPVLDLGIQPLANDFRKPDEEHAGYAPLKVVFCPRCSLAQLSVVVDPEVMYRRYSYVTSPSDTMRAHFDRLYTDLGVGEMSYVVEIGSNDGRMLKQWIGLNPKLGVLGIDPAANLADIARMNGVRTVCELFNETSARYVTDNFPRPQFPDLVIARHCFCHAADWHGFIRGLELLGHKETLYCIEVPYVADLLKNCEFDTIYHEHLSYLSIRAMQCLLNESNLHIEHIQRYPIHGGAIMLWIRRNESDKPVMDSVEEFMDGESVTVHDWIAFPELVKEKIANVTNMVRSLVMQGKSVSAFGASAKSTVWINACKFTKKDIAWIADDTPQKQWRFSPGSDIPIVDTGALLREQPDYVVLFAWNFATEILANHQAYTDKGGKFIVPVPKLRVVP